MFLPEALQFVVILQYRCHDQAPQFIQVDPRHLCRLCAESMVPKGSEWSGENWEIKTAKNLKDISQWELAAEVMPYMKTDDGTIPSIVIDQIGVYLGLIKGRGNVVDVREDSLAKAFKAGRIKANGLQQSLASPTSNNPKGTPEGDSLMGLETLSQKPAGSGDVDALAKAEEEFQKSLYGSAATISSSDEEGTSKTKRLHTRIRDKPVESTKVDVSKIKEATKQLSLPISRTKSLTSSSPDLGLVVPQPAPTASGTAAAHTSFPADMFDTDAFVQPTPVLQPTSMGPGVGLTAGQYQRTFSRTRCNPFRLRHDCLLPGHFSQDWIKILKVLKATKVPSTQGSAVAVDIGLAGSGVPPQVTHWASRWRYSSTFCASTCCTIRATNSDVTSSSLYPAC